MTMRCWDVCDEVSPGCVVFASKRGDARRLGNKHLLQDRDRGDFDMVAIERLPSSSGPAGKQLSAALALKTCGIGHRQDCGGWMILPPGIRPARSERANPTQMHSFVNSDDYQVVLFAHDDERADNLYHAIAGRLAVLPLGWARSEWDLWLLVGLVRHQRQAEERGIEGVGIYTKRGWQILPLDYEAVGIDPPDN